MPGDKNPFPQGKSGNPGGRPRVPPEVRKLLRERGPDAIKKQLALMDSPDERIALAAAIEIANRAYGKAVQPIAGEDEGAPIALALENLTDAELRSIVTLGSKVATSTGDDSAGEGGTGAA